jgi:hypothetical protein
MTVVWWELPTFSPGLIAAEHAEYHTGQIVLIARILSSSIPGC